MFSTKTNTAFNGFQLMISTAFVTLGEAAKMTEKDKGTILYRIKHKQENKRLPATKNDSGEWQIQVVDLERFFKLKLPVENKIQQQKSEYFNEIQHLKYEHELELKNTEIRRLRELLDKSETSSQQFYDLAQKNANLLTHYVDGKKVKEEKPKRDWLGRIKR